MPEPVDIICGKCPWAWRVMAGKEPEALAALQAHIREDHAPLKTAAMIDPAAPVMGKFGHA